MGLDDAPSWMIVSEHNVHAWPNSGLAPLPRRRGMFSYRFIALGLIGQARAEIRSHRGGQAYVPLGARLVLEIRVGSFPSSRRHAQREAFRGGNVLVAGPWSAAAWIGPKPPAPILEVSEVVRLSMVEPRQWAMRQN